MQIISGYPEEQYLQLSGLQHFLFCRRQWALIHIEQIWRENGRTVSGELMHQRAHEEQSTERRGNLLITRNMAISSRRLGVSGKCDIVEFHQTPNGVSLIGWEDTWMPFPVEYKNGEPKENMCDEAQLCGQAMCLEEMLLCRIESGALFYGHTKRRIHVEFTEELRLTVTKALKEMHRLTTRGYTPKVKAGKSCNACSLKEQCLPFLNYNRSVADYMEQSI